MSGDVVGLVGLFIAIGGQYALLFQIIRRMNDFQIEFATCPWHRTGKIHASGDEL